MENVIQYQNPLFKEAPAALPAEERIIIYNEKTERLDKLITVLEDYAKEKGYKLQPYRSTAEDRIEDKKILGHFRFAISKTKLKHIKDYKLGRISKEEYMLRVSENERNFKCLADVELSLESED